MRGLTSAADARTTLFTKGPVDSEAAAAALTKMRREKLPPIGRVGSDFRVVIGHPNLKPRDVGSQLFPGKYNLRRPRRRHQTRQDQRSHPAPMACPARCHSRIVLLNEGYHWTGWATIAILQNDFGFLQPPRTPMTYPWQCTFTRAVRYLPEARPGMMGPYRREQRSGTG